MARDVNTCEWCRKQYLGQRISIHRVDGEHWVDYHFCSRDCERAWHRNIGMLPNPGIQTGGNGCDCST